MPAGPDVKNIRFSIDDAIFCFNAKYVFSSTDVILPHEFMRNTHISFYKKVVYKKVGLQRTVGYYSRALPILVQLIHFA